MQGKKQYTEKLFTNFQLSERIQREDSKSDTGGTPSSEGSGKRLEKALLFVFKRTTTPLPPTALKNKNRLNRSVLLL